MRNYDPTDKWSVKDAKEYNLKPWMLELLQMNPDYNSWGPGEDYMSSSSESGWGGSVKVETWKEFGWGLDDLNELVNFHFEAHRPTTRLVSTECPECKDFQPVRMDFLIWST